jgi:hypothetical protein
MSKTATTPAASAKRSASVAFEDDIFADDAPVSFSQSAKHRPRVNVVLVNQKWPGVDDIDVNLLPKPKVASGDQPSDPLFIGAYQRDCGKLGHKGGTTICCGYRALCGQAGTWPFATIDYPFFCLAAGEEKLLNSILSCDGATPKQARIAKDLIKKQGEQKIAQAKVHAVINRHFDFWKKRTKHFYRTSQDPAIAADRLLVPGRRARRHRIEALAAAAE